MARLRVALGPGLGGDGKLKDVAPQAVLWGNGSGFSFHRHGQAPVAVADPWEGLAVGSASHVGLAVGFFAYELAPFLDPALAVRGGGAGLPLAYWAFLPPPPWPQASHAGPFTARGPLSCSLDAERFRRGVEAIRAAIGAGEVYQVNLTRRWEAGFSGDPAGLWAALVGPRPPRFAFFLEDRELGLAVLGLSPELFLVKRGNVLQSWPIKGTWDAAEAPEEPGEKEHAELAMIVDLVRHDLGRLCLLGSVKVACPSRPVRTRDVVHREAVVEGSLPPGVSFEDILTATFPGGSVTGAPKIAAASLIAALEPVPRSVYCGAYGVLLPGGDFTLAMPIRTGYVVGGRLFFHAGAGIVWDSEAGAEERETRAKVASWFQVLGEGT
ncbi:MAG: chorismate-binding protein [Thermoanaerobaculum sp.]